MRTYLKFNFIPRLFYGNILSIICQAPGFAMSLKYSQEPLENFLAKALQTPSEESVNLPSTLLWLGN